MLSKTVLLTGATGMIGSKVTQGLLSNGYTVIGLDRRAQDNTVSGYIHVQLDLTNKSGIEAVFSQHQIDRVIHLAALAHTAGVADLSYEAFYTANVTCSRNLFEVAAKYDVPVLFISTADVYGFVKDVATKDTPPKPVTTYGKTKYLAECALQETCERYDIFRFAPVYTDEIKRDIQKRYYLKYPNIAYRIGKGLEYEFLYVQTAVDALVSWAQKKVTSEIYNLHDGQLMSTTKCLQEEKKAGRAKVVLPVPYWMVAAGFAVIRGVTGGNKYTYLLNKAVHPLRSV